MFVFQNQASFGPWPERFCRWSLSKIKRSRHTGSGRGVCPTSLDWAQPLTGTFWDRKNRAQEMQMFIQEQKIKRGPHCNADGKVPPLPRTTLVCQGSCYRETWEQGPVWQCVGGRQGNPNLPVGSPALAHFARLAPWLPHRPLFRGGGNRLPNHLTPDAFSLV